MELKKYSDIKVGDTVYSFYPFPSAAKDMKISEYTVTNVKHSMDCYRGIVVELTIENYYKDDTNGNKDIIITKTGKHDKGDIAPSIEGLKEYWVNLHSVKVMEHEEKIRKIKMEIVRITDSINKIKNL